VGIGRSLAVTLIGVQGHVVEVEADIAAGLPAFTLVGLPDTSLVESRDRIRAASANSGCPLPMRRITVNLFPAALPKAGTTFDIAMAAALLAATGQVTPASPAGWVHLGELGLDGRVRPVRGVLPCVLAAARAGYHRIVVPAANAVEARLVPGVEIRAVEHLLDMFDLHGGERPLPPGPDHGADPGPALVDVKPPPATPPGASAHGDRAGGDLADVAGQREGRRALEVAAAGGHHLMLVGPPGAGKTMLAARLPGLLPDLDDDQALEVTTVHSVAGTLDPRTGLLRRPPFEDPHHTITVTALVGGGNGLPRPGAASRAHRGVLFLDEAAEFNPRALDALRQPLEHGELVIHRAMGTARFPARFQLVLAANPCPCGRSSGKGWECTCSATARRRYLSRLSGPLLDRVDLQVEVLPVSRAEMATDRRPESSAVVAARVAAARAAQRERLAGTPWTCNGDLPGSWLRGPVRLPPRITQDLDRALDRQQLTARGYDRVLRLSWTVSDLSGRVTPDRDDVGQALLLRHRPGVSR
jgi:magnesium chelatase family protein